jgi:hypothetical protein
MASQMLSGVYRGEASSIIVDTVDRYCRNVAHYSYILRRSWISIIALENDRKNGCIRKMIERQRCQIPPTPIDNFDEEDTD